jgi:hypothetical protein
MFAAIACRALIAPKTGCKPDTHAKKRATSIARFLFTAGFAWRKG